MTDFVSGLIEQNPPPPPAGFPVPGVRAACVPGGPGKKGASFPQGCIRRVIEVLVRGGGTGRNSVNITSRSHEIFPRTALGSFVFV